MFGKNKILKPEIHEGKNLKVQEIFATFQGEGPFVGYPSVFVRLGGCNLACDFCDTEFDSFKEFSLEEILQRIEELSVQNLSEKDLFVRQELKKMNIVLPQEIENWFEQKRKRNLVVITGGEPFRQPIERFCEELVKRKFLVQIETNGTLFREIPREVKIICSPKNPQKNSPKVVNHSKSYHKIRGDLLARIDALKFIISASNLGYQDIAEVGQSEYNIPVYLQPMDEYDEEKNRINAKLVLNLAKKHGAHISWQIHKMLEIS